MRQYQVPQFIDIEDKIVGPLTIRQFIYLAVGGAISVIAFYILNLFFFVLVAAPVIVLSLAMAFLKINGVPFPKVTTDGLNYLAKPRLYIWKQLPPERKSSAGESRTNTTAKIPKLTESKLQDIAWSLDIKEKFD